MSYTHLTSMERAKIEFFLAQGSRVCLLLSFRLRSAGALLPV